VRRKRTLVLAGLFLLLAACADGGPARPEVEGIPPGADQYWYAIEMNGTLAGYSHVVSYPDEIDGRPLTVVRQKIFTLLELLGSEFNSEVDLVYHVDPETEATVYSWAEARQGPSTYEWSARREGDVARLHSTVGGGDKTLDLAPDVIFPNPLASPYLTRDFIDGDLESRTYEMLAVREATVEPVVYTRLGEETLELDGKSLDTIVLEENHPELGFKLRSWLDRESAMVVQVELPNGRRIYLSEPRVVRKIQVANLTEDIASKVGVLIPDFQSISYMKVRAVFRPTGVTVTPAMLSVPGQSFEGTVEDNRVEGVFEIHHARYDGAGAPPFPPDFGDEESLGAWLEPSMGIESDDPVLIEHARQLTSGSADAWEAATRISRWVAENVQYAIPGGGSARRTYDQLAGECGSHSVLVAALNRAVGIPARVVWGCQYIPNYGGAFGQHGWNEVYMGEQAGWVPLDATAFEVDYVDSGHIRISGVLSSASALNPVEAEILEYRLSDGEIVVPAERDETAEQSPDTVPERYRPYVGRYQGPGGDEFTLKVDNGALVVDVAGRVALPMLDPDAEGVWRCKLTPSVYLVFDRDDAGEVKMMWLHEVVQMRKTASPDEVDSRVPDELRGHLGTYLLAQVNQQFTTVWRHGSLAIRKGDDGGFSRLERDPDEDGIWVSQASGNRIRFDTGDDGAVSGLTVDSAARVVRR
jgi:transglutaminase-like putative cysteine protease